MKGLRKSYIRNGITKVLTILMAFMFVISDVAYAVFKPGDEYKDGIQDLNQEELTGQSSNLVYYDDITDYTEVGILSVLGVVTSYENQSFKPNIYMSKGDFIESIIKLLNIPCDSDSKNFKQIFYDVSDTHPKAAYIYKALDAGLIYGYGNNTFSPDECISYNEAIAIIVRALGYDNVVTNLGGYPSGYLKLASKLDIDKNIKITTHEALRRIEVAKLLYNTLFANLASVQISSNTTSIDFEGEQFLYKYYKLNKATGKVNANAVANLTGEGYAPNILIIDGNKYYADSPAYEEFLGYLTDYYYDDDDNLVYMLRNKKSNEIIISAEDIVKFDFDTKTLEYYVGSKTKYAKLTSDFKLLYNGTMPQKTYDEKIFNITDGTVKLISDNNGSDYSVVSIEECKNYQIKNASLKNDKIDITFEFDVPRLVVDYNTTYVKLYDNTGNYLNIYKKNDSGEEKIDISSLKKNCIVSIYAPYGECNAQTGLPMDNIEFLKVVVSDVTIKGKASSYNADEKKAIINETEYTIANSNYFSTEGSEWNNQENEFYLDAYGHLTALKANTDSWKYGYIMKVYYDDESGEEDQPVGMMLLTSTGKRIRYNLIEKLRINGKRKKNQNTREILANSAQMVNPTFKYSQVIKYKLNEEDEITDIQTVTASVGLDSGYTSEQLQRWDITKEYRVETDTRRRILFDDSGIWRGAFFEPKIIFRVPKTETSDEKKYSKVVLDDSKGVIKMDAYDVDSLVPQVMVYYSDTDSEQRAVTGYNSPCIVMLNKSNLGLNEDDEVVLKFTVAQFGTVKEYYSTNQNLLDGYSQGQLFYLYEQDGEITKVEPIYVNGKIIGPDTLPSLSETVTFSDPELNRFEECYSVVNESEFVVQRGDYIGKGYNREIQTTGAFMHAEWAGGGVLVYDENDGKPIVRNGSISDLRPAESYGAKSSKMYSNAHLGAARQYIIYNLD